MNVQGQGEESNNRALISARDCLRRGWCPIPVKFRGKNPLAPRWQHLVLDEQGIEQAFRGEVNIGGLLGDRSGGLTDVDLDCWEARTLAKLVLPPTGAIFGRASSVASHRLYVTGLAATQDMAVIRFADPMRPKEGANLLELRIGGAQAAQTVLPGSVHESGEEVRWDEDGVPATVADDVLLRRVSLLASASLLMRYWAGKDSHIRHHTALALGGFLARCGYHPPMIRELVGGIARAASDEEYRDRARAAEDAARAQGAGKPAAGFPKLAEHFGKAVAEAIVGWMVYLPGDGDWGFEQAREAPRYTNGADRGADKGAEAPAAPLVAHKPYVIIGAANVPLRPWVYGKLLIRKNVTMTVAPGGMGKSSLVIVEALAQASGKPLLGIAPKRQLRIAYWNLEDPYDELRHRFEAAVLHYKLTQEDIDGRLFVNSGRDMPLIVAETTRGEARILRPVIDALVDENKAREIDVLVLDPYVSCNRVPENDNSAQNAIINEWGAVANRSNCAVHLVDHTRKMGGPEFEVTAESQRGAVAKRDASRVTRVLNQMTKEDGDNFGVDYLLHFRADKGKHNMSPPEKAVWYKIWNINLRNDPDAVMVDGVRCAEDDEVGVVVRWEPPNAFDGLTGADFDKVAAVIKGGEWRESVQSANWVGLAIAEALGLDADLPADKGRIKRLLKGYLKAGSLVVVERKDDKRNIRNFVEVAKIEQ